MPILLKTSFLINLLTTFEKFIYNYSTAVTTIDEVFYATISSRFVDINKLKIIPNFVDTDLYKPLKQNFELPAIFGKDNRKIKILYAGNIGFFQDWEPVFFAASQLENENIEFWIVGEGVQKSELEKQIKNQKISNIRIFPSQNRDDLPKINNFVDIHFIAINPKMEQEGFPSKVYTIMACAKPIVVVTGEKSPLYNFLKDKNCSKLITNNRNVNFTEAIRELASDKVLRERLGTNGYDVIIKNYSKKVVVTKYVNLLKSL